MKPRLVARVPRGVEQRPLDRRLEEVGLHPVGGRAPGSSERQQPGRGLRELDGDRCGHGSTQAVATDIRAPDSRSGAWGCATAFECILALIDSRQRTVGPMGFLGRRKERRLVALEELRRARQLVTEDVTVFGERLGRCTSRP